MTFEEAIKQLTSVQKFMDDNLNLRKASVGGFRRDNLGRAMGQRDGQHVRLQPVMGQITL